MAQADILEILEQHPGVLQTKLPELTGLKKQSIQTSLKGLIKWDKVKRERMRTGERSWTYALYLK